MIGPVGAGLLHPMRDPGTARRGAASALARYGHVPGPDETALLRAALGQAPIPLELLTGDWSRLDPGVVRLFATLHGHAGMAALAAPLRQRIAGLRRENALRYYMLTAELHAVVAALAAAGIEGLVLKGFALACRYYGDVGQRPMSDLDICVRPERFAEAVRCLAACGFRRFDPGAPSIEPRRTPQPGIGSHSLTFINERGVELDLHHNVLMCACWPGADDRFWDGAVAFPILGLPASTLNATDHLLQACLHGMPRNPVSPIRWVVDAAHLIAQAREPIDWQRLCRHAEQFDCRGPLAAALGYLRESFACPIPDQAFDALGRVPFSALSDRWFRATGQRLWAGSALADRLSSLLLEYRRYCRFHGNLPVSPAGLTRYYMAKWQIGSWRELLRELVRRSARPRNPSDRGAGTGASPPDADQSRSRRQFL